MRTSPTPAATCALLWRSCSGQTAWAPPEAIAGARCVFATRSSLRIVCETLCVRAQGGADAATNSMGRAAALAGVRARLPHRPSSPPFSLPSKLLLLQPARRLARSGARMLSRVQAQAQPPQTQPRRGLSWLQRSQGPQRGAIVEQPLHPSSSSSALPSVALEAGASGAPMQGAGGAGPGASRSARGGARGVTLAAPRAASAALPTAAAATAAVAASAALWAPRPQQGAAAAALPGSPLPPAAVPGTHMLPHRPASAPAAHAPVAAAATAAAAAAAAAAALLLPQPSGSTSQQQQQQQPATALTSTSVQHTLGAPPPPAVQPVITPAASSASLPQFQAHLASAPLPLLHQQHQAGAGSSAVPGGAEAPPAQALHSASAVAPEGAPAQLHQPLRVGLLLGGLALLGRQGRECNGKGRVAAPLATPGAREARQPPQERHSRSPGRACDGVHMLPSGQGLLLQPSTGLLPVASRRRAAETGGQGEGAGGRPRGWVWGRRRPASCEPPRPAQSEQAGAGDQPPLWSTPAAWLRAPASALASVPPAAADGAAPKAQGGGGTSSGGAPALPAVAAKAAGSLLQIHLHPHQAAHPWAALGHVARALTAVAHQHASRCLL